MNRWDVSVIRKAMADLQVDKLRQQSAIEEIQKQFDRNNSAMLSIIRDQCKHSNMVERRGHEPRENYHECELCGWRDTP